MLDFTVFSALSTVLLYFCLWDTPEKSRLKIRVLKFKNVLDKGYSLSSILCRKILGYS